MYACMYVCTQLLTLLCGKSLVQYFDPLVAVPTRITCAKMHNRCFLATCSEGRYTVCIKDGELNRVVMPDLDIGTTGGGSSNQTLFTKLGRG